MAQFCGKCGAQIAPGEGFCTKCGAMVTMNNAASATGNMYAGNMYTTPVQTGNAPGQSSINMGGMALGAIVGAVLLVFLGISTEIAFFAVIGSLMVIAALVLGILGIKQGGSSRTMGIIVVVLIGVVILLFVIVLIGENASNSNQSRGGYYYY